MTQQVIRVDPRLSNQEFLELYAAPGRIGLFGGLEVINRLISRAQRHVHDDGAWSRWSHAFIFQGRRHDGHHWLVESDLDLQRKHIRLGVQENRIAKYFDSSTTGALGIIDVGLTTSQVEKLLAAALEQVATHARYSLRELLGTVWAMRHPSWRPRRNILARDRSFFCSAFVRYCFEQVGVNLIQDLAIKNTTPEDLANLNQPHRLWLLERSEVPRSRLQLSRRLKIGERLGRVRKNTRKGR